MCLRFRAMRSPRKTRLSQTKTDRPAQIWIDMVLLFDVRMPIAALPSEVFSYTVPMSTRLPATQELGRAYLKERGFDPARPRDASWGERYFHMSDPDGHELSFARPI